MSDMIGLVCFVELMFYLPYDWEKGSRSQVWRGGGHLHRRVFERRRRCSQPTSLQITLTLSDTVG